MNARNRAIEEQPGNEIVANAAPGNINSLPDELRRAQEAIHLPEVQDMLRKLSAYHLGISMPHMHTEDTGEFLPLPADLVQVEAGLEVSFHPIAHIRQQLDSYIPVAWVWRDNAVTTMSMCYSYCEPPEEGHVHHTPKHRKE